MRVPAFLLRRLYVKGSLRNEERGFAFDLENKLGSGYAEEVLPIRVDGGEIPLDRASFSVDGETTSFAHVSSEKPMTLGLNERVIVRVEGEPLASGKHTIALGFIITGMGRMEFDVTDAIE
jgi:hydroxymethylglutaryl-CoA reductase (NADPH)